MRRDCGGVRTLLIQLPAGSNAVHEVYHGVLFTTKLVRSGGEDIQVVSSIPAGVGLGPPWETRTQV